MDDLYGGVSLRAALFADGDDAAAAAEETEMLAGPAQVDVLLEACTEEASGEWGVCDGGWQPVLSKVRGVLKRAAVATCCAYLMAALTPKQFLCVLHVTYEMKLVCVVCNLLRQIHTCRLFCI